MKDFTLLSDEEYSLICAAIPYKIVTNYFKRNPKQFSKIRPGFRANAIKADEAARILARSRQEHFVSSFVERIYKTQNKKYSLELGFATFFLNRTNRSGVLNAGPIGGLDQTGKYKIDVRFNKEELAKRIELIAKHKKKIHLYNHDIRSFLELFLPRYQEHAFVYFDPPYFSKGKQLYKNFFSEDDHQQILELIQKLQCPWMVTYDNTDRIKEIYEKYNCWYFDLSYGVANSGKNSEILFVSDDSILPSCDDQKTIRINFRNQP